MNPTLHAIRTGAARGWTEFRLGLTNPQDVSFYLTVPAVLLTVLWFQRDNDVEGITLPLASLAIPGVIGMTLVYGGLMSPGYLLSAEREDGTLLRAKALPHGMEGYVTGHILRVSLESVVSLLLLLVPGLILFQGLMAGGFGSWLGLAWVMVLGLLATVPLGFVVGALAKSPRAIGGWGFLVVGGLTAISGIFYPITALAGWVQAIAQVFPTYWVGLGMRAALLPSEAAAVEIGGSWRTLETIGVLGAWAVVGLLLAPVVLRRMARRESGASMEARRQAALQRIT